MKRLIVLGLLSGGVAALALEQTAGTNHPEPTIDGVTAPADRQSLVVHYHLGGHPHERVIQFPEPVTDFQYCRWLGATGIAIAASTTNHHFYYSATLLEGQESKPMAYKVPAPRGNAQLLGIANTGGDSIVITAGEHRRGQVDRVVGWMFFDNCPHIGSTMGDQAIIPFDIAGRSPVLKQGK